VPDFDKLATVATCWVMTFFVDKLGSAEHQDFFDWFRLQGGRGF
jgi:hypothetical protein